MGVEVLMVGALGWPTPTEDMGFWRPVLGELSLAVERAKEQFKTLKYNQTQYIIPSCSTAALARVHKQNANADTVCQAQ